VVVDGVNLGAVAAHTFTNVTANHTIAAYFSIDLFSVAGVAGPNGTVTPSGVSLVAYGDSISYSIAANVGYFISDVHVDSVSVGAVANYTFTNVTANHLLTADFALYSYPVTALAGPNGSVTPSGTTQVSHGGNLSVTITPAAGYFISDVHVDSVSVGAVSSYDFTNVTSSHLLTADFAINTYFVTALAGPNGSVSPAGVSTVNHGSNLTVNITPASGYFVSDVHVDSVSVGAVTSYTFNNVTANHLLQAFFGTNALPSAVELHSPDDLDTLFTAGLNAVPFAWSPSSDSDAGDTLSYTLTITGPSVNYTASGLTDTTTTLDLSSTLSVGVTYQWSVSVTDGEATVASADTFSFFVDATTGVDAADAIPKVYALTQNYPNPFNPSTTIRFDLPERSQVVLTVFNILGVRVMEFYGGEELAAGVYRETVDFSKLSSGAYFYRIEAHGVNGKSFTQVRKMVLMK
jgi:hypothetical protein